MKKFRLLLLDANIVIEIFRHGIWDEIVSRCDIHLASTVVGEAGFFDDQGGNRRSIDLTPFIDAKTITVFDFRPSDLTRFRARFDSSYLEKLDAGEVESLAHLLEQTEPCQICSADKIVYRVLGNLKRSDQGVSLQEILDQIGLGRDLARQFTRAYREEWTQKGFEEGLAGLGLRGVP